MTGRPPADAAPGRRRVLVLRFGAVGDLVLVTPALDALRAAWPDAHVSLATRAPFAAVAAANPHVDEVLPLAPDEPLWAYAARLRALQPDAILDLHQSLRSRALRLLLPRRPTGCWVRRPWLDDLLVRAGLRRFRPTMLLAERAHRAVEALVGRELPPGRLDYRVTDAQQARVDALLAARGLPPGAPLVALVPGANWATKRWPAARFAALAARALAQGLRPVLTGSPAEAALAAEVQRGAQGVVDLGAEVDLAHLGALLRRCRAVVANDSGPMHIARALGVPTLALFGSTDPSQFVFDGHRALSHPTPCAPCHPYGRRACPRGHFACMAGLDVERAWDALVPLLAHDRVPPVRG